jgi:hypothetical protein
MADRLSLGVGALSETDTKTPRSRRQLCRPALERFRYHDVLTVLFAGKSRISPYNAQQATDEKSGFKWNALKLGERNDPF